MNRRSGFLTTCLGVALILALTSWPNAEEVSQGAGFLCFLCGSRDLADGLLNLVLFIPFGAGISLLSGWLTALGASFAFSGIIELVQTNVPGRFSSVGDLFFNSFGGGLGALLVAKRHHLAGVIRAPSRGVKLLSLLFPIFVYLGTALMFSPNLPETIYYGQWTHELGNLKPYPGEVLSASVGGFPLRDGRAQDQTGIRNSLQSGEEIRLELRVGPSPPPEKSHVLAIYDEKQKEIFLLAVQGTDLLYRRRTLSVALRLDQPEMRWTGALKAAEEGDTVRISIHQTDLALCLETETDSRCDISSGVEGGWRLLHRPEGLPRFLVPVFGCIWLLCLSVPAGLTSSGMEAAKGIILGLGYLLVSGLSPWLSVHPAYVAFSILGVWIGALLRKQIAKRYAGIAHC